MKKCAACTEFHDESFKLCASCRKQRNDWKAAHPEKVQTMRKAYLDESREAGRRHRTRQRDKVLALFGNRCNDPRCRWLNDDGTLGCTAREMLQVDHINGGGRKEMSALRNHGKFYRKILNNQTGYQLLCANCNWQKKHEEKEFSSRRRKSTR